MTRIPNYEQYGSSRESLQMHFSKINVQDFSLRKSLQKCIQIKFKHSAFLLKGEFVRCTIL